MYRLPIKKGENLMKKYMTPEMEMMDFTIDTNIAADPASIFNDGQFGNW